MKFKLAIEKSGKDFGVCWVEGEKKESRLYTNHEATAKFIIEKCRTILDELKRDYNNGE